MNQHTKDKKNKIDEKIPDATTLIHITKCSRDKQTLKKKMEKLIKKVPDVRGLVTTTALMAVENKVPTVNNFYVKIKCENIYITLATAIRNGKIVWKIVWIEYLFELDFPKILVPRLPPNASNVNIECDGKSKQLYSLCDKLL